MGVLTGHEITRLVRAAQRNHPKPVPSIEIDPFDEKFAGPNSYDVHLSPELRVYRIRSVMDRYPECFTESEQRGAEPVPEGVDSRENNPTAVLWIPEDGMWLYPGILYLAATVERTLCHGLVPWLDGRSSVGRLGLSLHVTAGRGDDGWAGRWTCEVTAVTHPVKVYPNMRCGQVTFFTLEGERKLYEGRYQEQGGPTASRYWEDHGK